MLGFKGKENISKNEHLYDMSYYDRLIFYQYLAQSRIRFNHSFTYWGIINTASEYAIGNRKIKHNSFFGNTTTVQTFMRKTKSWRENMEEAIHIRLRNEVSIVACIDNNQKGYNMTHQRYGKSNKYIKVTGCVIKRHNYANLPQSTFN